jgi:hypothetical protein
MNRRNISMNISAHHKLQSLMHDRVFVDYCRKEIHEIVKYGKVDVNDIQNIVNIINYIVTKESKHAIPMDIFTDVLEALIIELLQKYGIQITDKMYETIFNCLTHILHGKKCEPHPKNISDYFNIYSI